MPLPSVPEASSPGEGLYVHLPFCASRCGYCDFVTWEGRDLEQPAYLDALAREAGRRHSQAARVETVFLGGGTPTRLGVIGLSRVFSEVVARFPVVPDAEITVEANPESATSEVLSRLRELGANRLSLGIQSFVDSELAAMGRAHDACEAEAAWHRAMAAGFERVSLDLIYGLPGQTRESFARTLERALALAPRHVSLYALTLEAGAEWNRRRPLAPDWEPDPDLQADLYEDAEARLGAEGLRPYEISNFAAPGHESRHNLKYWKGEPVLGLGVGAWGGRAGHRERNSASFEAYLEDQRLDRGPFLVESLTGVEVERERVVLGLRLAEGVDPAALQSRTESRRTLAILERYRALGLVSAEGPVWSLTARGRMLANEVMVEIL